MTTKVFFDITIEGSPLGRIVMQLFTEQVPVTCGNVYIKKKKKRRGLIFFGFLFFK